MIGAGGSLFDNDKSSLDEMQNTLKSMVFEIIYYLISGDIFPMFIYIFFVVIETFQIFYFAYATQVYITPIMLQFLSMWKVPMWSNGLQSFFGFFMIVPYLKGQSFQTFVLALYLVMGFFIMMIVLIVIIALKSKGTGVINYNHMILGGEQIVRAFGDIEVFL